MTGKDVIEALDLKPLPGEGGYYRETWRAAASLPSGVGAEGECALPCGTAIYYLLTDEPNGFSALHRLQADEIYHFYLGDPVDLFLLHPAGWAQSVILGPDLAGGQHVQFVVPKHTWQSLRLRAGGRFALLGTTMAPGFTPQGFTLGDRRELTERYPAQAGWIRELTR
jgi:hypothetical protein